MLKQQYLKPKILTQHNPKIRLIWYMLRKDRGRMLNLCFLLLNHCFCKSSKLHTYYFKSTVIHNVSRPWMWVRHVGQPQAVQHAKVCAESNVRTELRLWWGPRGLSGDSCRKLLRPEQWTLNGFEFELPLGGMVGIFYCGWISCCRHWVQLPSPRSV